MGCWRMVRPAPLLRETRRILIAQLDHLGDAVLSSPLFPRLRAAYPGARIDVLASPSNRAVFEADPHVDGVIVAERNWFGRHPGGWALGSAVWTLGRTLREGRYDLGIDVRGDILSVLVLALAGIPRRIGWGMGGGSFLLTDVAPWRPGRHELLSRLALLEQLGISGEEPARVQAYATEVDRARLAQDLQWAWPERAGLSVPVTVAAREDDSQRRPRVRHRDWRHEDGDRLHAGRFADAVPLLAVHLGAGTSAKRWRVAHWHRLIAWFLKDGWRVVVVGGHEDMELSVGLSAHPNLRDFTGRLTLGETVALLERADLFLGADSGPAHLAACAGVSSVVLFSGTNLIRQWRPWSRRSLVLRHRVACRPCHHKTCPLAGHDCMTGLRPETVYRMARRWWMRTNTGSRFERVLP
jgi:heptosyltransferase-2